MAGMTLKCAANKEKLPPSRHFNFDIDDDNFKIMSKPFNLRTHSYLHRGVSKPSLHGLKNGINTRLKRSALKMC